MNLNEYFANLRTGDYQLDSFKDFLKKVGFSFKIPSIHIAGSNGKGSTANYIAAAYRTLGLKVGLYTSPYLYEFTEMTSVNGEDIPLEFYEKTIKNVEKYIKKYDLSAFEVQTFVSFKYFEAMKCDICVIECGMGGEYDATNIFTPILSVITSISLEHTMYLGRTLSEIALHKAGIVKDRVPVVTGLIDADSLKVINDQAQACESKLYSSVEPSHVVLNNDGYSFDYMTYRDIKVRSKAMYSVYDACIALEALHVLNDRFPITNEQIQIGFYSVDMNCRMSIVKENPLIIIDGAHNPEGATNLRKALQNLNISNPIRIVFSCFKDKNLQGMLAILGETCDELILTTFDNPRARTLEDFFLFADDYKFIEDPKEAIKYIQEENPDSTIVVTGSLAFAAYVKKMFDEGEI